MRSGRPGLDRCAVAEAVGTTLLLAAVVGSGLMGERLAGGNVTIALLANTLATARHGLPQLVSEFVATFGLLAVIWGCARSRVAAVPFAVAASITAVYWFTASTSFVNPAVTTGRAVTDIFSGIRPADAPGFIAAQLAGAGAATALFRWLHRRSA